MMIDPDNKNMAIDDDGNLIKLVKVNTGEVIIGPMWLPV